MKRQLRGGKLLVLVLISAGFAQETAQLWSSGTAYNLPRGQWEKGLFQPLRLGISDKMELRINPLLGQLTPHVALKIGHGRRGNWKVATRHSLLSPTPLLRLVRREGTGGFLSVDPALGEIPWLFMTRQEVLVSSPWRGGMITAKGGLALAIGGKNLDKRHTIELPVIYPRMALFHHGFQMNLGVDATMVPSPKWSLLADVDLLATPGAIDNLALEHKGMLLWNKSDHLQLALGYKLSRGNYPWGAQWHLFPLIDVQIARGR